MSNWLGMWSLYKKEVFRFVKVYNQTIIAPVITSLIYLSIFTLAMGNHVEHVQGVPFKEFMGAGLIMMSVVQNAFANTSSTLVMGKVMGTIIDYIMPPLSVGQLLTATSLGGVTRGMVVGIMVTCSLLLFIPLKIHNVNFVIFHLIFASMLLSLLGILTGIIADGFEQMTTVTSYLITPLSFLSGTFYSVHDLPPFFYKLSHFNPFFYMIDGFRYGLTGYHDGSLIIGIQVMIASVLGMLMLLYYLLSIGWRIKN